jgi:hypothetical protein
MNRSPVVRIAVVLTAILALSLPAFAKDDALSLIPPNAATVGMVKVRELRNSSLFSTLFTETDKMSADGDAQKFLSDAGLDPTKDVDVVIVATSPRTNLGSDADVLVLAEGRFNVERLSNALTSRGAVQKNGYFVLPEKHDDVNGAVAFPSASLAIAGTERAVAAALEARANGGTSFRSANGLGLDLSRVDRDATAWALVDVARAARLTKGGSITTGKGKQGDALAAALRSVSTVAVWAKDTGSALELGAFGISSDTETLSLVEDTVRGALSALRLAVKDKQPEMVSVLRGFDVTRKNDSVTIEGSIPANVLR